MQLNSGQIFHLLARKYETHGALPSIKRANCQTIEFYRKSDPRRTFTADRAPSAENYESACICAARRPAGAHSQLVCNGELFFNAENAIILYATAISRLRSSDVQRWLI